MKLSSTIFFSVAVAAMVIGIHRTIVENNLIANYWIFMIALICLFVYRYQKKADNSGKE
ncbi:hypothetical protein [Adhaeribacter pallidiroseus]|uniref:Uncharacterized protein n=1 Tax=Adhaeribacter pallidiroseus TaxID=2072847 RepID=A0A369QRG2_9BACT|nr:hypothetical protein [Adhaeribacter pallidiroseus]RDC65896.1 hypothetical protein AHMF7616_04527 [Adhaeribacter pallidiroseus]